MRLAMNNVCYLISLFTKFVPSNAMCSTVGVGGDVVSDFCVEKKFQTYTNVLRIEKLASRVFWSLLTCTRSRVMMDL